MLAAPVTMESPFCICIVFVSVFVLVFVSVFVWVFVFVWALMQMQATCHIGISFLSRCLFVLVLADCLPFGWLVGFWAVSFYKSEDRIVLLLWWWWWWWALMQMPGPRAHRLLSLLLEKLLLSLGLRSFPTLHTPLFHRQCRPAGATEDLHLTLQL